MHIGTSFSISYFHIIRFDSLFADRIWTADDAFVSWNQPSRRCRGAATLPTSPRRIFKRGTLPVLSNRPRASPSRMPTLPSERKRRRPRSLFIWFVGVLIGDATLWSKPSLALYSSSIYVYSKVWICEICICKCWSFFALPLCHYLTCLCYEVQTN